MRFLALALLLAGCEAPTPQHWQYDDARASKPPYGVQTPDFSHYTPEQNMAVLRLLSAFPPAPAYVPPPQSYGTQTVCMPMYFNPGGVICNN